MRSKKSARMIDLAAWRQKAGISLSAIAEATKISERYLEDIEHGKFRSLPGGAYGLGYIRQYAQAIHYDVDRLVERYRAATCEPAPQPEPEKWTIRVWRRIRWLS
ncbi:MAG TPA: helix-turn-helix domain-containing protein [Bryobacteraceae bacterium]|nr:helix-turn-helix domain-containing protein [Bryobacteraceae bacterium]